MTKPSLDDGLLLEGVVTTTGPDGVNLAPMGPIVDASFSRVLLRPFKTSTTYQNLAAGGAAVLHVTDDVELIARAALDLLETPPKMVDAPNGGAILADACRWYALEVTSIDASDERVEIVAELTGQGGGRPFFGFNRAKHAVVEATILATRLNWLTKETVARQMEWLTPLVEKTGGPVERRAFALVEQFIASRHENIPRHENAEP